MAPILQHLKKIYYGSTPGALRGPKALYEQAKKMRLKNVTLAKCQEFLKSQPIYSRHRPARRNYKRNKIEASVPGDIVQVDIWDLRRLETENEAGYVLLSYDTFSKYLQAVPLKNRKPDTIQEALELMLRTSPFQWRAIYWDKEGSFVSRQVQKFLKDRKIHNYTTKSVVKAPGVERSIRTLRTLLQRRLEASGSLDWVKALPNIIANYNRRKHSTTEHPPNLLVAEPWTEVADTKDLPQRHRQKLPPIGSFVRLNRLRGLFEKEASDTWTEEVFRVIRHKTNLPIPMIVVEDLAGDKIQGALYPEEYQSVKWSGHRDIEKVLKTRKLKGKGKEYLVAYRGWPPKFNKWISRLPK